MVIRYLLDTDACIALIKNRPEAMAESIVTSFNGRGRNIRHCRGGSSGLVLRIRRRKDGMKPP